uniref:Uncharacterized protein n=1 Tax=Anguilla anguilla TaxID=7936 RepID=A0A0E9TS63_ANGAN
MQIWGIRSELRANLTFNPWVFHIVE